VFSVTAQLATYAGHGALARLAAPAAAAEYPRPAPG
jgi:hypothetical protein